MSSWTKKTPSIALYAWETDGLNGFPGVTQNLSRKGRAELTFPESGTTLPSLKSLQLWYRQKGRLGKRKKD